MDQQKDGKKDEDEESSLENVDMLDEDNGPLWDEGKEAPEEKCTWKGVRESNTLKFIARRADRV